MDQASDGNALRFDPRTHISKVNGKDYLQVKWRLVWLRTEHPEASVISELMNHERNTAIFRCCVTLPGGAESTGWGSESEEDFRDYIEKAETKAVGRALAMLGFGTQFAFELDEDPERPADAPVQRQANPAPARQAAQSAAPAMPPATATGQGVTDSQERMAIKLAGKIAGYKGQTISADRALAWVDTLATQKGGTPFSQMSKAEAGQFLNYLTNREKEEAKKVATAPDGAGKEAAPAPAPSNPEYSDEDLEPVPF